MKIKDLYPYKLIIYIYKHFFEEHLLLLFLLGALFLNLLSLFIVSFKGRPENYLIPLHYLLIKGVDQTGPWYMIYKIPLVGFFILLLNFFIIFSLNRKGNVKGSYLLASATIVLESFVVIASLLIAFKV